MNDKVLIELIVPAIEKKYNIFIPINKRVDEIVYLINKAINELTDKSFPLDYRAELINTMTGENLSYQSYLKDCNVLNGLKLVYM